MKVQVAASPRRWKNVALVLEPDRRRARRLWVLLLGVVAAFAPTSVYLLEQMEYVRVRYRIEALRAEQDRLQEQERRLRVERGALTAPLAVERRASELGLVRPRSQQVVVLDRAVATPTGMVARGSELLTTDEAGMNEASRGVPPPGVENDGAELP